MLVADDVASGVLSRALSQWSLPPGRIYTVYPPARFRPRKVTAFVEMFVAAERQKNSTALGHSKNQTRVSNAEGRLLRIPARRRDQ
jgi:hypothetical protein